MLGNELTYREDRRTQILSAIGTLLVHVLLFVIMSILIIITPKPVQLIEVDWGSTGAPNQSIRTTETQPSQQYKQVESSVSTDKSNIDVPKMKSPTEEIIPTTKKEVPKPSVDQKKEKGLSETVNKSRYRRERTGPASGAGKSTGYSIEWSGVGSRRLLSGRIPVYPEGTDKEMAVVLQFTVLPDGSVLNIIPLKRSDEILEREATSALRTWRFDPLPPQFEQVPQIGKVTFNFVLE